MLLTNKKGKLPIVASLLAVFAVASLAFSGTDAVAQKGKKSNPWVKLCELTPIKKGKDEKPVKKNICLTHHESLEPRTGLVLISAALREIEGEKDKRFMIMVPLGMVIKAGIQIHVDEGKKVDLPYTICMAGGCTAEIKANASLIKQLKTGKLLKIRVVRFGRPVGLALTLDGFKTALEGKPIDNKVYYSARKKLMEKIRTARIERIKAMKKKMAEQKGKK